MSRSVGNTPDVTSLQGGTAGQVAYQSAPSTTAFAGPGTSGQVLTSNGASAPTFEDVSPGAVSPTYTVYSSGSGSYTSPVGCTYIIAETVGGGGGGGKSTGTSIAGGGGGAGGYQKVKFSPGTYSYTVGQGAAGTSTAGSDGGGGAIGETAFGGRSTGGGYGGSGTTYIGGTGGGYGSGPGTLIVASTGGAGQSGSGLPFSTLGGSSVLGQPQARSASGSVPAAPLSKGAGGGGVDQYTATSGAGAPGIIIITEYY